MLPLAAVLMRGTIVVAVFGGLLLVTGFLRPTERAFIVSAWTRARRMRPEPSRIT
jgi:hypothetical protein